MPVVLITGAAGNLGSLLARHLLPTEHQLRLMVHRRPLPEDLARAARVEVVQADLARPETLAPACKGADCVVHFAGVLFQPWPERFLWQTNLEYFRNLLDAALAAQVGRIILVSFPHVEGETTPEHRAAGRLDAHPTSLHARSRLAEERLLLERCAGTATVPIILRVGMVYGPGILMVEAARWLLRRRLLPVWPRPTGVHLIATPDLLAALQAAIEQPAAHGIYHLGDDQPTTLQAFLDQLAAHEGVRRPWRLPFSLIFLGAFGVEVWASVFRTRAPLHRDFIRIGAASYCGDTTRMKQDLLPVLQVPALAEGLRQFD